MNEERDIKSFSVEYEDGAVKTFKKGFMAEIKEEKGGKMATVSFSMAGMSGRDLEILIFSVIRFGEEMGMFERYNG